MKSKYHLWVEQTLFVFSYLLFLYFLVDLCSHSIRSFLSSDSLYLFQFYRDLFFTGYGVSDWVLTSAPYFFPDMFFLFPFWGLFRNEGYSVLFYCWLGWTCMLIAGIEIVKRLGQFSYSWMPVISSFFSVLIFLHLNTNFEISGFFILPTFHSGCLYWGLIMMAWSLRWLNTSLKRTEAGLFVLVNWLMIVSDPLFLPQFLFPITAGWLALSLFNKNRRSIFYFFICVLILSILGAKLFYTINAKLDIFFIPYSTAVFKIPIQDIKNSCYLFLKQMPLYLLSNPIYGAAWVGSYFLLFCWGIRSVLRIRHPLKEFTQREELILILAVFIPISLIGTTTAILLQNRWPAFSSVRYLLPQFVFPFFLIAWLISAVSHPYARRILQWAFYVIVVAITLSLHFVKEPQNVFQGLKWPYPAWIQELDVYAARYGLKYGFSDYWNARYISIFSRSGLRVNFIADFMPKPWITNEAAYLLPDRSFPVYRFLVTERLPLKEVLHLFGSPARQASFGGKEFFIYDRIQDYGFRNFLKPNIHIRYNYPVSRPSQPRVLALYNPVGSLWNVPGTIVLERNKPQTVFFDPRARGDVLEICLDANDEYRVDFYETAAALIENNDPIGRITIPPVAVGGLLPRYVVIPKEIQNKSLAAITVTAVEGDGGYSVGHVFIYKDFYKIP